ncbi:MAG: LysR family transcriptional regulator [Ferrimicrobium sp.]
MEIKQLRSLLAIQEVGSFSGAAGALDTVQSNISSHISKLERELGTTLIDRSTGMLTEDGSRVARRAQAILAEISEISTDLESMEADVTGKVRVGIIATTAGWLLPPLLDLIRETHPHLQLEIAEGTSASLQRRLNTGLIDIGLITTPLTVDGLTFDPLLLEKYVLVVPAGHSLAHRSEVSVVEAAKFPLLVPPTHAGLREELDAIAASRGVTVRPLAQIDGLHVVASLALAGYGPAILPSSAVSKLSTSTVASAIPIIDLSPRRIGVGRRRNRLQTTAEKALIARLIDVLHNPRQQLPPGISVTGRSPGA